MEPCSEIKGFNGTERLGYRITQKFVTRYFGRVFADPASIFTNEMLKLNYKIRNHLARASII